MRYHWHNETTGEDIEVNCSIADIDKFLDTVESPDQWMRVIHPVGIRTAKLSSTYLDGYIEQSRAKPLNDLKQAANIEVDMMNQKPDNRAEHKAAIKQLRSDKK